MSFKSKLLKSSLFKVAVKLGIKLTPKVLVSGIANVVLKGIAKFSKISFDLNKRTAYVNVTLYGEEEPIEVTVDGFEISGEAGKDNYQFTLHNAQSNKPWMTNILARVTGKAWDIPPVPQFKDEVDFVASLLSKDNPKQIAKKPKMVAKKSKTVAKKPKTVAKKSKTIAKKSKAVAKKPKTVAKKSKTVAKKSKTVVKKPKTVVKKPKHEAVNSKAV